VGGGVGGGGGGGEERELFCGLTLCGLIKIKFTCLLAEHNAFGLTQIKTRQQRVISKCVMINLHVRLRVLLLYPLRCLKFSVQHKLIPRAS